MNSLTSSDYKFIIYILLAVTFIIVHPYTREAQAHDPNSIAGALYYAGTFAEQTSDEDDEDYADGFGLSWGSGMGTKDALNDMKDDADQDQSNADSSCPNTNASCQGVNDRHTATRSTLEWEIHSQFENYAEWWQIVFWEGCPSPPDPLNPANLLINDLSDTYLCDSDDDENSNGIKKLLPDVVQQVSTSRLKALEIRSKTFESQKMDDAKRIIQSKKKKAINEHQPSEELCKFASMISGKPRAKLQSEITFNESHRSVRYAIALGDASMADEKTRSNVAVENLLCKAANRENSDDSTLELCGNTVADTSKKDIGELANKNNWDENDRNAAIESTVAMFGSNRPSVFNPDTLNTNKGKEAYMRHRSVMSREMLGSYCSLKTYQDRMGGSDTSLPYLRALLEDYNFTAVQIDEMLGTSPSLHTQKEILLMLANQPTIGNDISDNKENILRLSNMIEGFKLSSMYDALDVMYCNQMISAQLFVDELLPFGTDVQEDVDSLRIAAGDTQNVNDYAKVNGHILTGGGL